MKRSPNIEAGSRSEDPTGRIHQEQICRAEIRRLNCPEYVGDLAPGYPTQNILDANQWDRGTTGRGVAEVAGVACANIEEAEAMEQIGPPLGTPGDVTCPANTG